MQIYSMYIYNKKNQCLYLTKDVVSLVAVEVGRGGDSHGVLVSSLMTSSVLIYFI